MAPLPFHKSWHLVTYQIVLRWDGTHRCNGNTALWIFKWGFKWRKSYTKFFLTVVLDSARATNGTENASVEIVIYQMRAEVVNLETMNVACYKKQAAFNFARTSSTFHDKHCTNLRILAYTCEVGTPYIVSAAASKAVSLLEMTYSSTLEMLTKRRCKFYSG